MKAKELKDLKAMSMEDLEKKLKALKEEIFCFAVPACYQPTRQPDAHQCSPQGYCKSQDHYPRKADKRLVCTGR